jgi:hypothetical protein
MAAGFAACNDEDVDAGLHLRDRVLLRADEHGKFERDLERAGGAVRAHVANEAGGAGAVLLDVARIDAVGGEDVAGKILVGLRHGREERFAAHVG